MTDYREIAKRIKLVRNMDGGIVIHLDGQPVGMMMNSPFVAGTTEAWFATALEDVERVIETKEERKVNAELEEWTTEAGLRRMLRDEIQKTLVEKQRLLDDIKEREGKIV